MKKIKIKINSGFISRMNIIIIFVIYWNTFLKSKMLFSRSVRPCSKPCLVKVLCYISHLILFAQHIIIAIFRRRNFQRTLSFIRSKYFMRQALVLNQYIRSWYNDNVSSRIEINLSLFCGFYTIIKCRIIIVIIIISPGIWWSK